MKVDLCWDKECDCQTSKPELVEIMRHSLDGIRQYSRASWVRPELANRALDYMRAKNPNRIYLLV